MNESKLGAVSAILLALCYLFGFALLATVMNPGDSSAWTPVQKLEFMLDRQVLFQLWNTVIYVVFGVILVALVVVLHRTFASASSLWESVATPFGFIWAGLVIASGMLATVGLEAAANVYAHDPEQAAELWLTLATVQNALGGGVEVVGGVWVLLLSIAALRVKPFGGRPLHGLGIAVGAAGVATLVPTLGMLGAVFGLLQIVWFVAVAFALLRSARA